MLCESSAALRREAVELLATAPARIVHGNFAGAISLYDCRLIRRLHRRKKTAKSAYERRLVAAEIARHIAS